MSQRATVTVTETVHVACPPEVVFDFTQDYARRTEWDDAILDARVASEEPRVIHLRGRGIGRYTLEYKLFRRPERTSAAFVDLSSPWFSGGGGSWRYEPNDGGTDWTQTNTLELRHPRLRWLLAPFVERTLRSSMRRAMATARATMERETSGDAASDRSG